MVIDKDTNYRIGGILSEEARMCGPLGLRGVRLAVAAAALDPDVVFPAVPARGVVSREAR